MPIRFNAGCPCCNCSVTLRVLSRLEVGCGDVVNDCVTAASDVLVWSGAGVQLTVLDPDGHQVVPVPGTAPQFADRTLWAEGTPQALTVPRRYNTYTAQPAGLKSGTYTLKIRYDGTGCPFPPGDPRNTFLWGSYLASLGYVFHPITQTWTGPPGSGPPPPAPPPNCQGLPIEPVTVPFTVDCTKPSPQTITVSAPLTQLPGKITNQVQYGLPAIPRRDLGLKIRNRKFDIDPASTPLSGGIIGSSLQPLGFSMGFAPILADDRTLDLTLTYYGDQYCGFHAVVYPDLNPAVYSGVTPPQQACCWNVMIFNFTPSAADLGNATFVSYLEKPVTVRSFTSEDDANAAIRAARDALAGPQFCFGDNATFHALNANEASASNPHGYCGKQVTGGFGGFPATVSGPPFGSDPYSGLNTAGLGTATFNSFSLTTTAVESPYRLDMTWSAGYTDPPSLLVTLPYLLWFGGPSPYTPAFIRRYSTWPHILPVEVIITDDAP